MISCGGEPTLPDIPGVEHAINSDGFFDLNAQPKKAAVIGAGYIAVEMAGILHGHVEASRTAAPVDHHLECARR